MPSNIYSAYNGPDGSTSYAKQVDQTAQSCTVLGDKSQQDDRPQKPVSKTLVTDMCVPPAENPKCSSVQKSSIIQVPCDSVKSCPQFACESCPPASPTKLWLLKSSPFLQKVFVMFSNCYKVKKKLQSYCLPVGGPFDTESAPTGSCKPTMVYLPCQPVFDEQKKEEEELTPIGLVTRFKDMDFIGGKMVYQCTCGRKNGLAGENCPRVSCQNNPGCTMNPPRCWPQIKTPKKPPPPLPDQEIICVPLQIVYYDQSKSY